MTTARTPLVVVIAGPNGAGKSTSAPLLLKDALAVEEFVNADTIASGLSAFNPEGVAITAGRLMLQRMKALANSQKDFAFETTLASRSFAPWLNRLKTDGYHVHLAFLSLPSADLAAARVDLRHRLGGHNVPRDVIRRRFEAGLRNFFRLYLPITTSWELFDNLDSGGPKLLAAGEGPEARTIYDEAMWQDLVERYAE